MAHLQDPIAPHSDSLCQIFNQEHPATVLTLLRYVARNRATISTDDPILSAKVVEVNQYGLTIDGRTAQGKHIQGTISFPGPVHSLTLATESFLKLGKQAKESLSSRESRKIPGQPPGLGVYWPHWTPFLIALAVSVSSFFFVYFFPNVSIQPFKWIKDTFGLETVTTCVHFAVFLHSFQLVTAWYLMKDVAKCSFSVKQVLIWSVCVQFFGIGSMLKLLPIVYNSAYVSQELEEENSLEA
ncbi:hypothetical protein EMPS_06494 [Entomortierella parvispora]|uniref:DUF2470 domain-containing protein n=1 Tax=Entomortierella parvispora TaxID=205924 RepID=A0A9P3HCC6_9FUNG|nr:hypothetical protein EMPS_06494 [Entomortierella parvispora]